MQITLVLGGICCADVECVILSCTVSPVVPVWIQKEIHPKNVVKVLTPFMELFSVTLVKHYSLSSTVDMSDNDNMNRVKSIIIPFLH